MPVPARLYSDNPLVRRCAALLLALIALSWSMPVSLAAWPDYPDPAIWPTTVADRFRFHVQPVRTDQDLPQAPYFTTEFYPLFESAVAHAETVLGITIPGPIDVDVYTSAAQFRGRVAAGDVAVSPHGAVALDLDQQRIAVDMPALLSASEIESDDSLRNALGQLVLIRAYSGQIPNALRAGIALYLELPTPEYLARLASLLDTAEQDDTLFTWFDLLTVGVPDEDDLVLGQTYSMTAFLINRYDIPSLRTFLTEMGSGADWTDAIRTAYQTDATGLEGAWRDNLPSWAVSGWRDNLMSSFDLQPARDLLAQGQYVSAKAILGPAQNLYRQLDDSRALTEVQRLISQADTGVQAEALMAEIEAALNGFDYARASNLLDQVETQYALLPADQVPTGTLETYRQMANDGTIALGQLQSASRLAGSWGRYPEARQAAQEAGNTFARLGDAERRAEAAAVVDRLDNRQRRLVVLLSGLGIITLAWLYFWLRARGPSDVVWA